MLSLVFARIRFLSGTVPNQNALFLLPLKLALMEAHLISFFVSFLSEYRTEQLFGN
jgi:hypothetical protein